MAEPQGCKVLWSVKGSNREFSLVCSYGKAMPGCNAAMTIKGKKAASAARAGTSEQIPSCLSCINNASHSLKYSFHRQVLFCFLATQFLNKDFCVN